jgi:predicted RND superfamily exporter protein
MLKAQRDLLRGQLLGLGASLALVGACLLAFFQSGRLAAKALPPNLLPIAAAAMTLALFQWPLDFASAQLAAMIFGLAVNGTIFLADSARRLKRPTPERLAILFGRLGPAVAVSAGLAAAAFACAGFSDLLSLRRLGLVASVAAVSAAAADLILLPALLSWKKFPSKRHYLQPDASAKERKSFKNRA